ncbi:right-handed parallel beta-helix repeat-containing protein [Rudanella lutea]|uniref:right-handed parallel beta-helix repeat-containing protein n=1 Tax=Rudanella lutea TaxID=451374 RepID=UPI00037813FB|nr:right-handed parallel beta-helix repeat-containing protein [Rudanella lutea]
MATTIPDLDLNMLRFIRRLVKQLVPGDTVPVSRDRIGSYLGAADFIQTPEGLIYARTSSSVPPDDLRVFAVRNKPTQRWMLTGTTPLGTEYTLSAFKRAGSSWTRAIADFFESGEKSLLVNIPRLEIDAPLTPPSGNGLRIRGISREGSVIVSRGDWAALNLTGHQSAEISDLGFEGAGLHTAIVGETNFYTRIENIGVRGFGRGIVLNSVGKETLFTSNRVSRCVVRGCEGPGIVLQRWAEYVTVDNNDVYDCAGPGIYAASGNVRMVNNTLVNNQGGILVEGSIGVESPSTAIDGYTLGENTDHGGIYSNTVNHNHIYGISLINLRYSTGVVGNQIWATIGPNGFNQNYRGTGYTVGLHLENCVNVQAVGNTIAHNRVNIAVKGVRTSRLDNSLIANPDYTQYHYLEIAGANVSQNEVVCSTSGDLKGGENRTFFPLTDTTNLGNTYRQKSSLTPQSIVLQNGDAAYTHVGNSQLIRVRTGYVPAVTLPPLWRGQSTTIEVEQLTAGASVLVAVTGAVLTSRTALCTVSGSTATLTGSGLYTFTQDLNGNCTITSDAVRELSRGVSFVNSWGQFSGLKTVGYWLDSSGRINLEGMMVGGSSNTTAFTLPVGYRPSSLRFLPVNRGEKFGAIHITDGGEVVVKGIDPGDWISLDGVSFRP